MARTLLQRLGRTWPIWLAALLCLWWLLEIWVGGAAGRWTATSAALIATVALALVLRFPFGACMAVLAVMGALAAIDPTALFDSDASGVYIVVVAGVLGSLCTSRERIVGIVVLVLGTLVVTLRIPADLLAEDDIGRLAWLIANVIVFVVVWAVAWTIASRVRANRDLRARALLLEREADERAQRAVADERARIARELHDVVAHSVSVMTVQAGGVRRLLGGDHPRESEALATIEETGRRALAEMRRMVGVMREGGGGAPLEPQRGLAQLDSLAAEMRDAGLPVKVTVDGSIDGLPVGVDLSAYRIVQEGLTNALKHAGPAQAWVGVRRRPASIEVTVADNGRGPQDRGSAGNGLIGMRERVAVYGGTLVTGPREGGGFELLATLPLAAEGRSLVTEESRQASAEDR